MSAGVDKRLFAGLATALVVLLTTGGCAGKVVEEQQTETATADELERVLSLDIASVDCPPDIEAEPQQRFSCEVNTVGAADPLTAELKVLNEEGKLQVVEVRD